MFQVAALSICVTKFYSIEPGDNIRYVTSPQCAHI